MSIKIVKSKVARSIYLLRFRTQYELAATFLRVQEHYESPKFHGRVFSLEQYMEWYATRYGNFTNFQDWSGFNVPSTALKAFYEGKFDPLSAKEKRLLRLFENLRERFYVIGVFDGGAKGSLTHELAHALYFTNASYRQEARAALRGYNTSVLEQELAKVGYAKHVIPDEVQAYLVGSSSKLGTVSRELGPLRRKLRALFREHSEGLSVPKIS